MSSASDTAVMLLTICDAPEAVAPLLALAEVDRPTTWSPAPAMRASLSLNEAVPFAKKGVGYAIMVASAPDPSGQVLSALSKFPQKGVWRRLARNPDCNNSTVLTLLSRGDSETLQAVVEFTDPRYWIEWLETNEPKWMTCLAEQPGINSSSRWARSSAATFMARWSKDVAEDFIRSVITKSIGKTWAAEALRAAASNSACLTADEVLALLPYEGKDRFMVIMSALGPYSTLSDKLIEELSGCAPLEGDPNQVYTGVPGPAGTDEQVLRLLAASSPFLKAMAMESVLGHCAKYTAHTVNTVLSDDYVASLNRSWNAVKHGHRTSAPEWEGFDLLTPATIDKVVARTRFLKNQHRYGGVGYEEWTFAPYLSRQSRKRLLSASSVMDWVPWLCGAQPRFEPEFDLLLEMLTERGNNGKPMTMEEVRDMLATNQTLHRISALPNGTGEVKFHDEALKLVDFCGRAALAYVSENLTAYTGSTGTVVLAAVQEVISRAQPHPEAWSVVASLAPTWTGSITELVDTANAMYGM